MSSTSASGSHGLPHASGARIFSDITTFGWVSLCLLLLALAAGGASRENLIEAEVIELASLALWPWTVMRLARNYLAGALTWPIVIVFAIVLVTAIQFIPLPPLLWQGLPGQDAPTAVYQALQIDPPWRGAGLAPALGVHSALAMVTPITVFFSWVTLSSRERRLGVALILGFAVVSLLLGAVQLADAGGSAGYLYPNTNFGSLVGFFSNRNHEATLLLCSPPLVAGFVQSARRRDKNPRMVAIFGLALVFAVITALAAVHSRAGILLLGPSLLISWLMLLTAGDRGRSNRLSLILVGLLAAAFFLVFQFGISPLLARFETNIIDDERFTVAPTIWNLGLSHLPLGSGLGSFDIVYRTHEGVGILRESFLNHAHDDYLELFLETGVLGIAVVAGFLVWFCGQVWRVWRRRGHNFGLERAGTAVIGLMLLHSTLDYPLRTLALSSVFAFACALLIPTPSRAAS